MSEAKSDPRARLVDALMSLAAERRFEDITIRDVATAANVSLAEFRDLFPSKGAVLGAFNRKLDRAVLSASTEELATESDRDRLFDVLMRRLDAMAPYREGLREISAWLRRDPIGATRVNGLLLNSMRFMLEAAGLDSEGPAGGLKVQGLVLAWSRIVNVWLDDEDPGLARTMAAMDRELTQGERFVRGVDQLDRLASPLKALARAAMSAGERARERVRRRPSEEFHDDAGRDDGDADEARAF